MDSFQVFPVFEIFECRHQDATNKGAITSTVRQFGDDTGEDHFNI